MSRLWTADIRFRDIININFQRIRNKKLRTVLTVFGIGIGIAAVLFLVGLTFGLQKLVVDQVANADSLITLDVVANTNVADIIALDEAAINKIKAMPETTLISPVKSVAAELNVPELKTQGALFGVENSYFNLAGRTAMFGTFFTDAPEDVSKVVISSTTAKLLGFADPKNALDQKTGLSLLVPNKVEQTTEVFPLANNFTILGVVEDEANFVFIPISNFKAVNYPDYFELKVKAKDSLSVSTLKDKITGLGFAVTALIDTLNQMNKVFHISQIVFGVIGLVALFIASIGMFNTMTIALLERTKEIGVMKAIGATDRAIRQMFLVESIIVGFLGGVAGIVLGYVSIFIINWSIDRVAGAFGGQPVALFYIPTWFLLTIIILSVFIGYLTGLYPSHRAAKLNPLDALRYE